jgi:glycosyltransferase involved in cell wall biosynthesis
MKKQKLVYIVSDIDKALHFEWISPTLQDEYHLNYILLGKKGTELELFLEQRKIAVVVFPYKNKIDLVLILFKVCKILVKLRADIIHCHLLTANLVGLAAGWITGVKKRIYTRHHAAIHHDAHPSGVKLDKLCNFFATHIIAISKNVEEILINRDGAKKQKVIFIHHGFDLDYLKDVSKARVHQLQQKYELADRKPVVGVISRFTKLKGIQYIIPAFAKVLKDFPDSHLILANANGDYAGHINEMLENLPSGVCTKILFEPDLAALYRLFDVFIHVPIKKSSEAFGQTYVEALAAGIPSVFTLSGVAPEFIEHERNALVVDFHDSEQIYKSIIRLLNDKVLTSNIIQQGKIDTERFSIKVYLNSIINLYSK